MPNNGNMIKHNIDNRAQLHIILIIFLTYPLVYLKRNAMSKTFSKHFHNI